MKFLISLSILFACQVTNAQNIVQKLLPGSACSIQYAGSIGWLSAGYFRRTSNEKIELGLLYGYTPEFAGGILHTATFKFIYNPFRFDVTSDFQIEPIQTGFFIAQNFGKNLYLTWPDKYPEGYYFWPNSTRFHFFLSSEVSFPLNKKTLKRLSFYFEANTNDLYLMSYFPSENSVRLYDIFFFGIGSKLYFN